MKKVVELSFTSGTISGLAPKVMAGVEEAAKKVAIGRQLLIENRQLQREGGRTLTFPRRTAGTGAGIVAQGTTPAELSASYTTVAVTVTKIGVYFKVTEEAIETSRVDIVEDLMQEAGYAIADYEDWMIMDELYGASAYVTATVPAAAGNATTIFTIGTSKILNVNLLAAPSGVSIKYIDYWDGKIETTSTATQIGISYKYSTRTRCVEVSTVATDGNTYLALVDGRANLSLVPRKPDTAVVHVKHWSNLVKDTRFIDASQYGDREAILNGEVGKAAGMKIVVADRAYPGAVLVMQKGINAYLVIKRDITMKRKELPEEDAYAFYFYLEEIPFVTNDDSICLVFNAAEGSKDL